MANQQNPSAETITPPFCCMQPFSSKTGKTMIELRCALHHPDLREWSYLLLLGRDMHEHQGLAIYLREISARKGTTITRGSATVLVIFGLHISLVIVLSGLCYAFSRHKYLTVELNQRWSAAPKAPLHHLNPVTRTAQIPPTRTCSNCSVLVLHSLNIQQVNWWRMLWVNLMSGLNDWFRFFFELNKI